jgi:hypothetical protein
MTFSLSNEAVLSDSEYESAVSRSITSKNKDWSREILTIIYRHLAHLLRWNS